MILSASTNGLKGVYKTMLVHFNDSIYKDNPKARIMVLRFDEILFDIYRSESFTKGYKKWVKTEGIPPSYRDSIESSIMNVNKGHFMRFYKAKVKQEMIECLDFILEFQ